MEKQGARFERLLLCRSACIQHLVEIVAINVWLRAASFFFSASETRRDGLLAFCAFKHTENTREDKRSTSGGMTRIMQGEMEVQ